MPRHYIPELSWGGAAAGGLYSGYGGAWGRGGKRSVHDMEAQSIR